MKSEREEDGVQDPLQKEKLCKTSLTEQISSTI